MTTVTAAGTVGLTEQTDPFCLSPDAADRLLAGAPWRRFVVVGDSIAEGVLEPRDGYLPESWAERVAAGLRRQQPALELRNVGERYLRSDQVLATQLAAAEAFRPDLAAVVCGGNDLLVTRWDPGRTATALEEIVRRLVDTGADVVTYAMFDIAAALALPPEFGSELAERLARHADITRAIAQRHGTIHVELRVHPASAQPETYASDFQHASARGHAVAAAATIHALGRRLGNPAEAAPWPTPPLLRDHGVSQGDTRASG